MTMLQVVEFGVYKMGVETSGRMPEAAWLAGWLRDLVTREKVPLHPSESSVWLANKIEAQWSGGRRYFVEVRDSNRVGLVRIDGVCSREGRH